MSSSSADRPAVVTLAIGERFMRIAALTVPAMARYAGRLGADLVVIDRPLLGRHPAWEKLQLHGILASRPRAIFLDIDVVVRGFAPDLFALVPEGHFGALLLESANLEAYAAMAREYCLSNRLPLRDGLDRYFNSGIMVASAAHLAVFEPPPRPVPDSMWEQTWLNVRRHNLGIPLFDLGGSVHYSAKYGDAAGAETAPFVHWHGWPREDVERDVRERIARWPDCAATPA